MARAECSTGDVVSLIWQNAVDEANEIGPAGKFHVLLRIPLTSPAIPALPQFLEDLHTRPHPQNAR